MSSITARERVQIALDHREPDRVPLDFGTGGNSSPVPEFYRKLAAQYGIQAEVRFLPHDLRLAHVDECILRDLAIDTRHLLMRPTTRLRRPCGLPGQFYDEWGVRWKEVDTGAIIYRELTESPLANATTEDLKTYPWWPNALDPDRYRGLKTEAESLYTQTQYALVGAPGFNGVWERAWYMCGPERAMHGLLLEPEFMHALLHRIVDACKAALGLYLDNAGRYLQIIKLSDDLGLREGPMMAPDTYRRMIEPYHKDLIQFIKKRTSARVYFHTCCSMEPLLPDLIDAGMDILNPVSVGAAKMDTRRLKTQYGDRLSFMGAIDTRYVLPFGNVEDVKCEVERRIADLAPGGGYILSPVYSIQSDVPAQNLITMYRHGREVGRYPLKRFQPWRVEIRD